MGTGRDVTAIVKGYVIEQPTRRAGALRRARGNDTGSHPAVQTVIEVRRRTATTSPFAVAPAAMPDAPPQATVPTDATVPTVGARPAARAKKPDDGANVTARLAVV